MLTVRIKFRLLLLLFLITASVTALKGQGIRVINLKELENILSHKNDSVYVTNFWATWCKPCVQELPIFDTAVTFFNTSKVKVLLVSLDFKRELNNRVRKFAKQRKPLPEILLLDEVDYNKWIDKVSNNWSGSIPATLIFSKDNRIFLEKELTFSELKSHIITLLNEHDDKKN